MRLPFKGLLGSKARLNLKATVEETDKSSVVAPQSCFVALYFMFYKVLLLTKALLTTTLKRCCSKVVARCREGRERAGKDRGGPGAERGREGERGGERGEER